MSVAEFLALLYIISMPYCLGVSDGVKCKKSEDAL